MKLTLAILSIVCYLSCHILIEAALQVGFYNDRCSCAESVIREEVTKAFFENKGIAPGIIRLQFHDCFVRGCDGSVFIDSTPDNRAEKDGLANGITIRGFEVIDNAKARLEDVCKGIVSCADILAIAARDSVVLTGGLHWNVPTGRRDGRISRASETVDIPGPFDNLDQITRSFENKGLTQEDMVALLGSHTIGHSHCFSFSRRLYNFNNVMGQDPNLNPFYAEYLKQQCPRDLQGSLKESTVVMNQTPYVMDSSYYTNLFKNGGLFVSDQELLDKPRTAQQSAYYAVNDYAWKVDFVRAMIKLSQIDVLTGSNGEIRANCRVINP
ncbi:peroxidase 5-like [Amaranthus tricolor]|uniref:peroxidase 5-like n=1 Tax=Amaranthus tricolor TaxID=29722 RepID=UPI00259076C3|nr:peroxidase 5-like [Amaranthus tricolor]